MGEDKFLVGFLRALSHQQILFIVWAFIVGGFVWGMLGYYKKATRRNFKEEEGRVKTSKALVVKEPEKLEKID